MKKLIFIWITFLCIFSTQSSFAYSLWQKDQKVIDKAGELLWTLEPSQSLVWFQNWVQLITSTLPKYQSSQRSQAILLQLQKHFQEIVDYKLNKENTIWDTQDPSLTETTNLSKQEFFDAYGRQITTGLEVPTKCVENYDFVDTIAKDEDFPTPLILAVWWIETNCNMYNPANGWWLFQITSQYFEPGNVGYIELESQIRNFIAFSRNKWNYFNTNTYHNYKSRFGGENIDIHYNSYTLRDLRLHSILYNWVSSTTTLEWNTFANANLNPGVSGRSDGVVTRFLKVLNWEIQNNK